MPKKGKQEIKKVQPLTRNKYFKEGSSSQEHFTKHIFFCIPSLIFDHDSKRDDFSNATRALKISPSLVPTGRPDGAFGRVCRWTVEGRALRAHLWYLQTDHPNLWEAQGLWGKKLLDHKLCTQHSLLLHVLIVMVVWIGYFLHSTETGPPVWHVASRIQ